MSLKQKLPVPLRQILRWVRRLLDPHPVRTKHTGEVGYWQRVWDSEGGRFSESHAVGYETIMCRLAGQPDSNFVRGLVVADFGCGPMGSLAWASPARVRIGIDVLADEYRRFGIAVQDMCYVWASEQRIPLPSDYVDVLFTMNALDHVWNLPEACAELVRILAPGGLLIGAFNLDEPPTDCEPQRLTEARLRDALLRPLTIEHYRVVPWGPPEALYLHCWEDAPDPGSGPRLLWLRARKPQRSASVLR